MESFGHQDTNDKEVQPLRMKMNDCAELYQVSCNVTKFDAVYFLEQNKDRIKWKPVGDRSIDIGCADGSVTTILESYLPSNYKSLLGCDINEAMVKFANKHHGTDRTQFKCFDIEGDLPHEMVKGYDHVFSLYTLQWIRRQEKAFGNIYNMIDDFGDCFLTFLAHTPVYSVYQALAATDKWSTYLTDLEYFVSPYHDCQEPDKKVFDIMTKIGFKDIDVKCKQLIYIYKTMEAFTNLMLAVNPYHIPNKLLNEFVEDIKKVARDMRLVHLNEKNVETLRCKYNLIVVYAQK
ncbi:hypothetical protein K1T71_008611 [Dendrolimus kikuchii]|uniref:Uncharacterized protein n=1 Tax=Dendrolimus kikuchii TaxID=765133 RepID=A0ACC1CW02_9NEOP|nr:hypothetical protein K1T71_008611 [Dendrolimus kikuchii]